MMSEETISATYSLNLCYFAAGMHYLHSEAPVKVIHRDLKSRNGKMFHLQRCRSYICAL